MPIEIAIFLIERFGNFFDFYKYKKRNRYFDCKKEPLVLLQ
jgi:hypothetical protein